MQPVLLSHYVLVSAAAFACGSGIAEAWLPNGPFALALALSAALHLAWAQAAVRRKALAIAWPAWLVSWFYCRSGLAVIHPSGQSWLLALVLELLPLLAALQVGPPLDPREALAGLRERVAALLVEWDLLIALFRPRRYL